MTEVLFEEQFLAETTGSGKYRDFIENLRTKLTKRWSHNRPQLMLQMDMPTVFFTIDISTNLHTVRFWFRADNLYLIGYRVTTAEDSHWWECNNKPMTHLINDQQYGFQVQWMGFTGDYPVLAKNADRSLLETPFGISSLVAAINNLAEAIEGDYKTKARSLMVVITMICEATRLNPVLKEIVRLYYQETLVHEWMKDMINSWSDLTKILVWADADERDSYIIPTSKVILPPSIEPITTIAEVMQILGILLGVCFHQRRTRRSLDDDGGDDQEQCFVGSPLLHVFSVRMDNIDGENPGELYGTITINNGMYTEYIYNRTRESAENIIPGQNATLVGPSSCISALDDFPIDLALTDKDVISSDDLLISHQITWNANAIGNTYDTLLSEEVTSPNGKCTVNYAVIRNAVSANISIILQKGPDSPSQVYGNAYARYSDWDTFSVENITFLYQADKGNNVNVPISQPIPLLRSKIAVPVTSSLNITATIYDHNYIENDVLIATGTVQLPIPDDIPGTTSNDIYGDDGNFATIKVDWNYV